MLALALAAVMAVGTALTGCSSSSAAPSSSSAETEAPGGSEADGGSDTLTWVLTADIVSMDPTQAYDDLTNMVVNQVTEGLLCFDENNAIVNTLCESWECVDNVTYVYNIRSDIKFSDGNPMTMEDVIWSLERNRDPEVASLVGWMYSCVDTIEQTGDWQITVHLAYPDATWQYTFATTAGHVIEKAANEADGSFIGTAAYKLEKWDSGTQIVLVRNENYSTTTDPIYFNKVVYNIISEDTTRVEALTSGQADMALNPPIDMLPQLQESDNVNVDMFDTFGIDFLAFNTKRAPFDDVNVRRAIASAIDINLIYDSWLEGIYSKSTGLPFSSVLYDSVGGSAKWDSYAASYNKYPTDLEAAKDFLSKSAYPDGFECTLAINQTSFANSEALYILDTLAKIGITVNIEKMDQDAMYSIQFGSTWDQANDCRDFDMGLFFWYADYPDASGHLVPNYHSTNAGVGGSNTSGYSNADVDALLDKQLTLTDPNERADLMQQALDIMADEVPVIIIDYPRQGSMENVSLGNFKVNSSYVWNIFVRQMSRQAQ